MNEAPELNAGERKSIAAAGQHTNKRMARRSPSLDCTCPRCGSDYTRALAVLHQNGTRDFRSTRSGYSTSRRGLSFSQSGSHGRSTTKCAAMAAPPSTPGSTMPALIASMALGALFGGVGGALIGVFSMFVLAAVGGAYRGPVLAKELEDWTNKFSCRRCGTTFAPAFISEPQWLRGER